jgi:hypothetical protein
MVLSFQFTIVLVLVYTNAAMPPTAHPTPDAKILETVETYISWGSSSGKTMPDCDRFMSVFGVNRTWASPFTGSEFYVYDVQKSCKQLAQNLSWHAASLEAGNYLYPFYTQNSNYMWKIGFVWTAVGGANGWSTVLNLQEYNMEIITTLWFQVYPDNVSYIFMANDLFWPTAGPAFPVELKDMVDSYVSFLGGDCKTWSQLFWLDVGMVTVSGDDTEYFGPTQLTEYCSKMVYMWSSYVHNVHHMTYSVDNYSGKVNYVAFTWTRTGVCEGKVRTDEVLTVFEVQPDKTPTEDLKISTATEYFQPPEQQR